MKVLFLCHRFPFPPEGGGKIRSWHIVRHLAESGHDVTLCSLIRAESEEAGVPTLKALGIRVEAARVDDRVQVLRMISRLPTSEPSSFGYFYSPQLASRIRALLDEARWDLIFAHCSSMGPYVSHVAKVPKIMDFADMDSQKWMDYSRERRFPATAIYSLEGWKLRREEANIARAFDFCTTISRNELETLEQFATGARADWFQNGVDLEYFHPDPAHFDPDLIAFVGRMDYYPNEQAMRWFCDSVWPRLLERRPTLKLRIVGANPPRSVRRLAEIAGVEVTGFVPDVRPHVARACLSVAPLKIARGMQNKVLECMAMGVPVVTTHRVARGLGLDAESPLLVADTADQYVEKIMMLVASAAERTRLAEASRRLAESRFSWSQAMAKLDAILGQALGGAQQNRAR